MILTAYKKKQLYTLSFLNESSEEVSGKIAESCSEFKSLDSNEKAESLEIYTGFNLTLKEFFCSEKFNKSISKT